MVAHLNVVMLLNFLVDWLLIMGTNRLCGYGPSPGRAALGATLGGIYGGVCLLPGFAFLGNTLWRTVMLALMAMLAFGLHRSTLRRGVIFLLLSMALGGMAVGMGTDRLWTLPVAAGVVCMLCILGFRGKLGAAYIPVELSYGGRQLKLTALRDTGNTLRDPLTGGPVLVVDGASASKLTGLTDDQLRRPVEAMGAIPGLRLIPYHSVGTQSGMLLALNLKQVKIGTWCGTHVVAFAPEKLSMDGEYQALTGGAA